MDDIPCSTRTCEHGGPGEADDHAGEVKSTVEPILVFAQIVARIFGKGKRMVGTRQCRLQVAEKGVDPLELGMCVGHGFSDSRISY